jgi:hypothetical protein
MITGLGTARYCTTKDLAALLKAGTVRLKSAAGADM